MRKYLKPLLKKIENNGGATFKKGQPIAYKSGYQVGITGVEAATIEEVIKAIKRFESCGVWFSEGIWYIDKSIRVSTKKEAVQKGKDYNQQSILKWNDMSLVWISEN